MPDPSEILPILVAILVAAGAIFAFTRARALSSPALRTTLRVASALLGTLTLLVAAALIFFAIRYTRHLPPAISDDGQHLAITTYTVDNGTGVDQVEVTVRHTWSPYAHSVYTGPSKYDPTTAPEPLVAWQSNSQLKVTFHTYLDTPVTTATAQACATEAAGITVTCEQIRVHARH